MAINDVHEESVARDVVIDARCTQIDSGLATLRDNLVKTVGALTREAVANTMPTQSSPDTSAFAKTIGDLEVELATVKLAMQNMELQQSKTNEQRTDDSIANRIAMLSEPVPPAPGLGYAGTSRAGLGNINGGARLC